MDTQKKRPFAPFVTLEQIVAYRSDDPATSTGEKFIDALIDAMRVVGAGSGTRIARYMDIEIHQLSHTIKTLTGYTLTQVRDLWTVAEAKRLARIHPDWGTLQLAHRLGFAGRSGLWHATHPDAAAKRAERRARQDALLRRIREDTSASQARLDSMHKNQ